MLCLHQVLELFCQLAEPEKIVGDLWKELHVASGVTGEAGNHLEKAVPSWEKSPFRARAYTVFISRKKYSPLHTVRVFRWFSAHFRVKALFFKHSHGQQSIHMGGERLWRVEKASLHTEKPMKIIGTKQHNRPFHCEGLKKQAFTLETPENQVRKAFVWRSECFFREIKYV